jgi:hypothetical protein
MGSLRKITATGLAVVIAAGFIVATEAGAKKKSHKKRFVGSQITLQQASVEGISGRVFSNKDCRRQRQVGLYRVNSQASVPSNEYVTSTWTRGDGSWTFPGPQFPGLYFAEVSKRKLPKTKKKGKKKGAVVCGFADSNGSGFG